MNDQDRINQLEIERDEAKCATDFANLRITQLEAACAAMRVQIKETRQWLGMCRCVTGESRKAGFEQIDKALSTDAGKSMLGRLQTVERDNALLKEQIRVADVAYQSLHERHQAVEKSHTALRLASEELIACVRHGDQEDIGEAMAKVEAILQPAQKEQQ